VECSLKVHILEVHVGLSLVYKQFSHLDMVIEGSQVKRRVPIILLLIHNPGSRQFHEENPHGTANTNRKQFRVPEDYYMESYTNLSVL
jgi:hypothetical protein